MKYIFKDSCIGVSVFRQAGASPTITLVSVGDITDSTANVNVSIADGDDVSKTGVQVDTDPTFSNPTQYEENGAVNTIAVDNLTEETTYYVRGYVVWSGQTIYSSNTLNFTTASVPSILPDELQGCEYLKTDGNAYIKLTGVDISQIRTAKVKIIGDSAFGINLTTPRLFRTLGVSGKYAFNWFNNTNITSSTSIANICTITLDDDTDTITFNGETKISSVARTYFNGTLMLFGFNNNGNYQTFGNTPTIYYFETNIFNLISCYVKSGKTFIDNKGNVCSAGTCGMYDIVNQVFYTNDGTGTFSHGADINI